MTSQTLETVESLEALPDYGLDMVLTNEVGIDPSELISDERGPFILNGCSMILYHAFQQLATTSINSWQPVLWRSKQIMMSGADEVVARQALQAIVDGDAKLTEASQNFVADVLGISSELIRLKRSDELGYDERYTVDWMGSNPIANTLLSAPHLWRAGNLGDSPGRLSANDYIARTAFMYIID